MPEEEMGSKRYSSKLLKNIPSCMGETHPIHAMLCGSSMEVHITSTPTTSFPCKSSTATGPAMSPYPCASSRRNQHYVSEGACPNYRLPCQMWERAALDPNTCTLGSTLIPHCRINHRSLHLIVALKALHILPSSPLLEYPLVLF